MALRDLIEEEIRLGRLNPQWTTTDLVNNRVLLDEFEISTLRTDPPNRSTSLPGLGLGNGHNVIQDRPVYLRVGRRGREIYILCQNMLKE
jgi:hypothetical protein